MIKPLCLVVCFHSSESQADSGFGHLDTNDLRSPSPEMYADVSPKNKRRKVRIISCQWKTIV